MSEVFKTGLTVPGDIAEGSHSYEGVLMETADLALSVLKHNVTAERRRIVGPVVCKVVVEAHTEEK